MVRVRLPSVRRTLPKPPGRACGTAGHGPGRAAPAQCLKDLPRHRVAHVEHRVLHQLRQRPGQVHVVRDGLQVGVEAVAEAQLRVVERLVGAGLCPRDPARKKRGPTPLPLCQPRSSALSQGHWWWKRWHWPGLACVPLPPPHLCLLPLPYRPAPPTDSASPPTPTFEPPAVLGSGSSTFLNPVNPHGACASHPESVCWGGGGSPLGGRSLFKSSAHSSTGMFLLFPHSFTGVSVLSEY